MMIDLTLGKIILQNLARNETFARQIAPYLKTEYFEDKIESAVFDVVSSYILKTNRLPQRNVLAIDIVEHEKLNQKEIEDAKEYISEIYSLEEVKDEKWLMEQTESFCQDRAMYLAIMEAISIYDGTNKTLSPHAVPELIRDALSVNFDTKIGSDWLADAEGRFDRYSTPQNKLGFDLGTLNDITFNGVTRKTLNMILGGVHVGKTMCLVHLSAGYARNGHNVLYFSMEMGEDEIMQRIDANMLKVSMNKIEELGKTKFMNRLQTLKQKSYGQIKVIQFPTSSAHVGHFKNVINDLQLKQHWKPDLIMVDYVGIVASSRLKPGQTNSHFYLKSVAEELRALAIETDTAVWSAMQITRSGMSNGDLEMTDIAESIGIPGVCDFMAAVTRNEQMDGMGQLQWKQLKNRYRNMVYRPRFIIGCELEQQLLFDVAESEQNISDSSYEINTPKIQDKFSSPQRKLIRRTNMSDIDVGE